MKPRHDSESDADENKGNEPQETWPGEESPLTERGLMTSEKLFWVQIAATIVSPLIVAGVLWFGTFMGNTATKNDLKELRTEIKADIDRVEKRIEGVRTEIKTDIDRVEKKIEAQTERIDRLLLHLVPKEKQ